MSPEQALGFSKQVDERSDVFSLGVIFFEILAASGPTLQPATPESRTTEQPPAPPSQAAARLGPGDQSGGPCGPGPDLPPRDRPIPAGSVSLGPRPGRRPGPVAAPAPGGEVSGCTFPHHDRPGPGRRSCCLPSASVPCRSLDEDAPPRPTAASAAPRGKPTLAGPEPPKARVGGRPEHAPTEAPVSSSAKPERGSTTSGPAPRQGMSEQSDPPEGCRRGRSQGLQPCGIAIPGERGCSHRQRRGDRFLVGLPRPASYNADRVMIERSDPTGSLP